MRQIGIAIPTFNRYQILFESFAEVHDDDRIKEVIISDDASEMGIRSAMIEMGSCFKKTRFNWNEANIDCYANKMTALVHSNTEWNILLDSDNKIGVEYLDRIFAYDEWDKDTIYTPDFAAPHFDFRAYSGLLITKESVSQYIDKPMFEVLLNACNYFVNKHEYLKVWDKNTNPVTSDSIYMAYKWLESGRKIQVVEGLMYFHRVWEGSHYQNNVHRTPQGFHESILNKLRQLK
jgi:glycosyltransferase involved in cell wall biosynthesis